jgi:hypothetical protein
LSGLQRTRAERLAEFFTRLAALPAPRTADEALEQISTTLDAVEDAYSGVPKQEPPPPPNMPDGRMYPPLADHIDRRPDGSIIAATRRHLIEIAADGSVCIRHAGSSMVEYERTGAAP